MAEFRYCMPFINKHEGYRKFTDDPDDPGGPTMNGITLALATRYGITTVYDLQRMTDDQVNTIYREEFWRFDALDSQCMATKVMDFCVNFGERVGVKLLQQALVDLVVECTVDGSFGPKTAAAVNSATHDELFTHICTEASERYNDIVAHRAASKKFLAGWKARANDDPSQCEEEK